MRQLFLLFFLIFTVSGSWAQVSDTLQGETGAASDGQVDAVLSGLDITRRVLGGDDSEPDDWPSVVALARPGTSRLQDRFFCGGTIVADRWVMTAAHCLFDAFGRQDEPSSIRVIAGIHDLVLDAALEEVVVTNIIVHPDYDNSIDSPPSDIALLELATTLDAPVGVLFVGESEDYTGTIGYIVGWGATRFINENAAEYPTTQQEAPVPLVSLATCNSPISYSGLVAVTQMCAGYAEGQIDTCAGDSGGPLYIVENGQVYQVGITSFGNGCGQENFYGIYTNVSHYIPWLSNYITVPEQSPELIASREAGSVEESTDDSSGLFGAAMSPFYLLLLFSASLVRRVGGCLNTSASWRSCTRRKKTLVAPLALLMSACTVPSIGAQSSSAHPPEPSMESSSMSKVHTLRLNEGSLRPGFDGLQLGATHEEMLDNLAVAHWQKPACVTGKTALRGTGRLFQTEHCSVDAAGRVALHGREVGTLDLFLLDQQLVRIDVELISADTEALMDDTLTDLSVLLDNNYHQAGALLADENAEAARSWRHEDDQIRLYPGRRLQFIDGRLDASLPALYDLNAPFAIE